MALYRERRFDAEGKQMPLGHAHPIELSSENVRRILSGLTYSRERLILDDEAGPVFSARELALIATPLALALRELSSDERLRFLTVTERRSLVLGGQVGTSGVIFAGAPGEVNIVFDMLRDGVNVGDGNAERIRFPDDPVEVRDPPFRLVALPEAPVSAQPRANWVVVDPSAAPRPVVQRPPETAPGPPPTPVADPPETAPTTAPPAEDAVTFPYKGFTVVRYAGRFYGIAASEGPFDPEKLRKGEYKTLFERASIEKVIESVDALIDSVRD